jgi:hypothetical protein
MNGYGFFSALRFLGFVVCIVIGAVVGFTWFIWTHVSTLLNYKQQYGAEWQTQYEEFIGPLSGVYTRISLAAFGIVAVIGLAIWLFKTLRTNPGQARTDGKQSRKRDSSPIERKVRYKRNALLGVYFGLAGIVASVALTVMDWGLFRDHDDEISLAIFVFLGGYTGVIVGCGYWLKAKRWNEALVCIGFLPLIIMFIPFVRLIFIASPYVLPVAMLMMPLILVVVVFALPDQSTSTRRRQ